MSAPKAPERIRTVDPIFDMLSTYWGYDTLRPLQEEAIRCNLARQDSLLVMPRDGAKSLSY